MRVAILTTDNREQQNRYELHEPFFGPAPSALIEGFRQLGNEVELHVISCSKKKMSYPEKLAENIWFHQPIVSHIGWGRTMFLGCVVAVRKLLKDIQPDLVHGQGTERDCSVSAVLSGYPNVITLHGIMRSVARSMQAKPFSYYGMASVLEAFAIHRTTGVFCNSAYTESMVESIARTTWRVPNCIRPEFFTRPQKSDNRGNTIVVLGSIIHYKQPTSILRMWSGLTEATGDMKLVFVGNSNNDEYGQTFKNLLLDPSLAGRVEHFNWLECDELISLLDSSRGMIHFPTEESFGLAVAEGLARNLKLFAARTGGVPDVANGADGVEFFADDDWAGLARQVCVWIQQGLPIPNSAPLIEQRFSPLSVAYQHLDIYRSVTGL